ncbi:MAG: HD domain-containing phosphohydrolase [Clostridia bacterium]
MKIDTKKGLSIKSVVIIVYTILVAIAFTVIIYTLFNNSIDAARKEADTACTELNNKICNIIKSNIDITDHINKVYEDMISSSIVSMDDESARNSMLISFLKNHSDNISIFGYIDINGKIHFASKQPDSQISISSSDAESFVSDINYDEWYKQIIESRAISSSSVSISNWSTLPAIKNIYPIINENGIYTGALYIEIDLLGVYSTINDLMTDYKDSAYIIDKSTEMVLFDSESKQTLPDSHIKEYGIYNQYLKYINTSDKSFSNGGLIRGNYYSFSEYSHGNINLIIATSVPHRYYLESFKDNMSIFILFTVISLAISSLLYHILSDKLIKPLNNLVVYAADISDGNLDVKIPVIQDNEIGKLSYSFNDMTERLKNLIGNLEKTVDERTDKLIATNEQLKESKERLQIILNSTAEAIYGVDLDGICTFCNNSCLKILGYDTEEQLLGKRMHDLLFDSDKNAHSGCRIIEYMKNGQALHEDNGEFLRSDKSIIYVEFHSYPQYKNSNVIGAVVTFLDISQKKLNMERIKYLSYHDVLTGLANRRKFEETIDNIDLLSSMPYSVIFADINGLKMTNDIFGHATGDDLIIKAAQILEENANTNSFVARIGGDEFIILLPNTNSIEASNIVQAIKEEIGRTKIAAIMCSISIGSDTIIDDRITIEQAISTAENKMYREKVMNRKNNNSNLLKDLINTLHERSPREVTHSHNVSELAEKIANAMKLTEPMVKKIKLAGYMHDIGKIVLEEDILKKENYSDEEREQFHLHPVHGYRILNLFDETLDIAEGIYCHHEKWNGTGYPKGLKESEIPLIARIIAVAEAYDALINRKSSSAFTKEEALDEIKKASGVTLDPYITNLFIDII